MALKQHLLLVLESGTVYPVTLKSVNPLSFSSQKLKIGFLKTALANFVRLTSNESATCKLPIKCVFLWLLDLEVDLVPRKPWNMSLYNNSMNDSYWLFARGPSFRVFQGSWIYNWGYCYYTLFICIYVSVSVQPTCTGGRLGVHKTFRRRSVTTYGRLVCFQDTLCVVGVRFYLSVIFIFFVKVNLD